MAAVVTENFDSYANASDLNGQGGWSGTASGFTVTNAVSQSSPNSVKWNSNTGATITKTITGAATGKQIVYMRVDTMVADTDEMLTTIRDVSSNLAGDVRFRRVSGSYYAELRGTSVVDLNGGSAISTSTFYKFELEWDVSRNSGNGQVRARINDGTFSAWINGFAAFGNITQVQMRVSLDAGTNTLYWDSFSDGATTATGNFFPFF